MALIKKTLATMAALLVLGNLIWAEVETLDKVPRRLVLFVEAEPGAELSEAELITLRDSLLIRMIQASSEYVVFEPLQEDSAPGSDSERSRIAGKMGADAWLSVNVEGTLDELKLRVASMDLLENETVIELTLEKKGIRGLERRFWDEVVKAVKEKYKKLPQKIIGGEVEAATVTIRAIPGTEITGLTEQPLLVDSEGGVELILFRGATYEFQAHRTGYYTYTRSFYVSQPALEVECEQQEVARLGWEIYLSKAVYPGVAYSLYFIPTPLYVRLGLTYYYLGLPVFGMDSRADIPMVHLNAAFGLYINRPEDIIRLYVSGGAFLRIVNYIDIKEPERSYAGFEELSFFGFYPLLGFEVSSSPHIRLYLEYCPIFYLLQEPELGSAYYEYLQEIGGSMPPYVLVGPLLIDFTNINIGLRFQF